MDCRDRLKKYRRHSTRRNNPALAEVDMDPDSLMRVNRKQANESSLPAGRLLTAVELTARNVTFTDENLLAFWSDDARRVASEHSNDNPIDECERKT